MSFNIGDLVSPVKQVDPEIQFNNLTRGHEPEGQSPKSDDDFFGGFDENVFCSPVKVDTTLDLRRPLRRLFDDDSDRASPKKKLRSFKEAAPSCRTPSKNQASASSDNASAQALSSLNADPIFKTPTKSASRTPVKTPAQKRGDVDHVTPVKAASRDDHRMISGMSRTPQKASENLSSQFEATLSSAETFQPEATTTPTKSKSPVKRSTGRRKEAKSPAERTPPKSSGRRRLHKSISDDAESIGASPKLSASLRAPEEKTPAKAETESEPSNTAKQNPDPVTPSVFERPCRRKSTSIRFGIDDVPFEALLSPSGKSVRSIRPNIDTPPKNLTPKSSRIASPASHPAGPNFSSKPKLRRAPKSLFAAECSETAEVDATDLGPKNPPKEAQSDASAKDKVDPWQMEDPSKAAQDASTKRALRSKSGRFEQETATAEVRVPTVISFSKSLNSKMSNDDDGDDDVDDDIDDALGRRILEISSLNKKHLHGAEPSPAPSSAKTRTPKRLRSGAKKVSPNSKRRRLSIKYLNDPPPITDTSAIFDSRYRKMADVSVDDAEPRNDGPATPDPKSPVKSWSVSRYESPRGEIKMTLFNRKKKPESSPFLPVNRISRRMTNDTGWNCLIPGSKILALVAGKKYVVVL